MENPEERFVVKKGKNNRKPFRSIDILFIARSNEGSVLIPHADDFVTKGTILMATCKRGHEWKVPAKNLHEWCMICSIIDTAGSCGNYIECAQTTYNYGCGQFPFVCRSGHTSMLSRVGCKGGCKSCLLEYEYPKIRIDIVCLNAHKESRMRMQCMDCKQDFYADSVQLQTRNDPVHHCKQHHQNWNYKSGVILSIRTMEILCGERFDDITHNPSILFTGYCRRLGIAFTHLGDDYKSKKGKGETPAGCTGWASNWCIANNVKFIQIPPNLQDGSRVTTSIVNQLIGFGDLGITKENSERRVQWVRDTNRIMKSKGGDYVNRCVFKDPEQM